jgi:hypothetical protein
MNLVEFGERERLRELQPAQLHGVAVPREVPRHDQRPPDRVHRGPGFGAWRAREDELHRQRPAADRQERVHTGGVGIRQRPVLAVHACVDALGRAADTEGAQEAVGIERGGTEDFRQPSGRDPPVHFHLPEPVLRVRIAEPERGIVLACGDHVWNAVRVALDAHGLLQQRHSHRSFVHRQARLPEPEKDTDDADKQQHGGEARDAQRSHVASATRARRRRRFRRAHRTTLRAAHP